MALRFWVLAALATLQATARLSPSPVIARESFPDLYEASVVELQVRRVRLRRAAAHRGPRTGCNPGCSPASISSR